MTRHTRLDVRPWVPRREGLALAGLLVFAFVVRCVGLDQPIVENYVGRQVPTAMVARNLERGSGFLRPEIDVAPLPNRFLVEPPIFAWVAVGLRRVTGLPLEAAGRLTSALGIVLGAWGLYGLVARREENAEALAAVGVFVLLPVTIRYGRAFQGDALMLGCVIAGIRCWDGFEQKGGRGSLVAGIFWLATGLALKVVAGFVLVPLVGVVIRDRKPWKVALAVATLLPAAVWYVHAAGLIAAGGGSRASADNGAVWLHVLVPSAWLRIETYANIVRFLGVRAFTPLGPVLALAGFWVWPREGDQLWRIWGASALTSLAVLAAKLHHEYYWLAVAPVVAVGVARALRRSGACRTHGNMGAGVLTVCLLGLAVALTRSTWKTPAEWVSLRAAASEVRAIVPPEDWVVAPEALLFEAERRGCRLERTVGAACRAAGEWGETLSGQSPADLVEFYRRHGARFFADVVPEPIDAERLALHTEVRRRYNVVVDRPGVLIARLDDIR